MEIGQSGIHNRNVIGDRRVTGRKQHGPFQESSCPTNVASEEVGIAPVVEDDIVFAEPNGVPVGEIRQVEAPQRS